MRSREATGWRLRNVNLTVRDRHTALIGESGCGKTSLLNILTGFEELTEGRIQQAPDLAKSDWPLFWSPADGGLWPGLTVRDQLDLVSQKQKRPDLPAARRWWGNLLPFRKPLASRTSHPRTNELLRALNLESCADRLPQTLSAGETDRASVARALCSCALVILLDEPLSHVDPVHRMDYWESIVGFAERHGSTLVFATHHPELCLSVNAEIVGIRGGRCELRTTGDELYDSPPSLYWGRFAGPLNWLVDSPNGLLVPASDTEPRRNSPDQRPDPRGYRPEHLRLVPCSDGPFVVRQSKSLGGFCRTQLEDHRKAPHMINHSPCGALDAGTAVRVEVVQETPAKADRTVVAQPEPAFAEYSA